MKPFPCENCDMNTRCVSVWKEKHFVTQPGEIRSKNDGDVHFISHADLVRLYRVPPFKSWKWDGHTLRNTGTVYHVHLFPSYLGEYNVVDRCKGQHYEVDGIMTEN